jgi:hypothetical protein
MCLNKEISLTTYAIGIISCILLYYRNYKIEALFYGFVIQMQLIEYFLWLNNKCDSTNKIITKIGILINHLQPVILYLLIIFLNYNNINEYIKIIINIIIIIYIISIIYYFSYNYKLLNSCTVGIPNEKELQWEIQYGKSRRLYYIFVFTLCLFLLFGLNKHNYLNSYLMLLSLIISYSIYEKTKGVGTIWCLLAAYIPVLLNIVYTIK